MSYKVKVYSNDSSYLLWATDDIKKAISNATNRSNKHQGVVFITDGSYSRWGNGESSFYLNGEQLNTNLIQIMKQYHNPTVTVTDFKKYEWNYLRNEIKVIDHSDSIDSVPALYGFMRKSESNVVYKATCSDGKVLYFADKKEVDKEHFDSVIKWWEKRRKQHESKLNTKVHVYTSIAKAVSEDTDGTFNWLQRELDKVIQELGKIESECEMTDVQRQKVEFLRQQLNEIFEAFDYMD